jgi:hypothetical protein
MRASFSSLPLDEEHSQRQQDQHLQEVPVNLFVAGVGPKVVQTLNAAWSVTGTPTASMNGG